MTVDLLPDEAPDAEDFFARWLAPLMRAGTEHRTTDSYPFAVVQFIAGTDDECTGFEDGVIQVDYLDVARNGLVAAQAAKVTAREGHRRIMYLGKHCSDVTMSDGTTANCDYINVSLAPMRMDSADERVVRYVARYQFGLSFVESVDFDGS